MAFKNPSPAQHTQTSSSPGSPAACKHSPVTPPESGSSWFLPGRLPEEDTHGKITETDRMKESDMVFVKQRAWSFPQNQDSVFVGVRQPSMIGKYLIQ